MHKVSHLIVTYMETNNLNTLFVGKNTGWKEGINIGKLTIKILLLYHIICL